MQDLGAALQTVSRAHSERIRPARPAPTCEAGRAVAELVRRRPGRDRARRTDALACRMQSFLSLQGAKPWI